MNDGSNRLASEKSPYLLQHAGNPVDWYPWGDEAFARARREDKPVFLSIGYSTCHWCHVMAHESFEDPEVARLLNQTFVSIKVDREERPDIDMQYMKVCQMMTGSGGWPLSVFMTSDKLPFFATTYIPRDTRFGRVGLTDLVPRLGHLWKTRKEELVASAAQVTGALTKTAGTAGERLVEAELHLCYQQLVQSFDEKWGGFGIAPKFPTAHTLVFLLRYWNRTGEQKALHMAERTLQSLQLGGIHDHVGHGFHRYSTDRQWLVPHFEKMMYDQALLASAFIEAYQATHNEEYALTARRTLDYVLRDMSSPQGGFYAAEDADSEGKEGKYYIWTPDEIVSVVGRDDAALFLKAFNVVESGNFASETTGENSGENIPYLSQSYQELAQESKIPVIELRERMEILRQKLFVQREGRVHPHKDDKILTDWNGLVVAAMAQAGRVLGERRFIEAARHTVEFIMNSLVDSDGRLLHRYRDGEAAIRGTIDDYAFLVHGLVELYETTFEPRYLKEALRLNDVMLKHFWDESVGGLYFTADDAEPLLSRQKEFYDGATPSGNSLAMLNMVRLARITGDPGLEEKAAAIGAAFAEDVRQSPSSHTEMMVALDFALGPSHEVVIAGTGGRDTDEMVRAVNSAYAPLKVVILVPGQGQAEEVHNLAPFTRELVAVENRATAYVCLDHSCQLPTADPAEMLSLLGQKSR